MNDVTLADNDEQQITAHGMVLRLVSDTSKIDGEEEKSHLEQFNNSMLRE